MLIPDTDDSFWYDPYGVEETEEERIARYRQDPDFCELCGSFHKEPLICEIPRLERELREKGSH